MENTAVSTINIIFITPSGKEIYCKAYPGQTVLSAAHAYDAHQSESSEDEVMLEGACEGSLACSTCHVILEPEEFGIFPPAEEDEEDMLDLAFGIEPTSRLGCQLILTPQMEGFKFRIPSGSRNHK